MRVERVVLEHHRDITIRRIDGIHNAAANMQVSVGDILKPRDHAQHRRLATSRRADEHDKLAFLNGETRRFHGFETVGVNLAESVQSNLSHGKFLTYRIPSGPLRTSSGRK